VKASVIALISIATITSACTTPRSNERNDSQRRPTAPATDCGSRAESVDFKHQQVTKEKFSNEEWTCGNFRDAQVSDVAFVQTDLASADFSGAALTGVDFSDTSLFGARFDGAHLRNVTFANANLRNAVFEGTDLDSVEFINTTCPTGELSSEVGGTCEGFGV
jgi:uncharacterized protein YjbI with pentapeptide repeats